MRWAEVTVSTKSDEIDDLCLRLEAAGVGGMVVEDERDFHDFLENNRQYWDYVDSSLEECYRGLSRVKFYLADDDGGRALLEEIRKKLPEPLEVSYIDDADWENNWREYYKPLEIGSRLLVVPEWEQADTGGRLTLRLDPGLIFGTGSHATTRMCLCALEELSKPGGRVLDLGCGSGILAIGALILGCGSAAGCDIDPKAPDIAASNAALNGIGGDRFRIYAGDVLSDAGLRAVLCSGYDIVLANIVADVIIPLCSTAGSFMKEDGFFVCSGIIEGRQAEVEAALAANGFAITSHRCEEDWHCYTARLA